MACDGCGRRERVERLGARCNDCWQKFLEDGMRQAAPGKERESPDISSSNSTTTTPTTAACSAVKPAAAAASSSMNHEAENGNDKGDHRDDDEDDDGDNVRDDDDDDDDDDDAAASSSPAYPSDVDDDNDNVEEELRGVFTESGELYLVNDRTNIVYYGERSDEGQLVEAGVSGNGQLIVPGLVPTTQWQCEDADHCETPMEAIKDVEPILNALAAALGKDRCSLRIYDPYYCAGGMRIHLAKLGFTSVYNKPEDFYSVQEERAKHPDYDVIVTNPPYSSTPVNHVLKLAKFLYAQPKPWLVVQPNYVYTKDAWQALVRRHDPQPFFLTPKTPRSYVYQAPAELRRDVQKRKQLKTSPFVTFWFCNLQQYQERVLDGIRSGLLAERPDVRIAVRSRYLPDNFKDARDLTRRKPVKRKTDTVAGMRTSQGSVTAGGAGGVDDGGDGDDGLEQLSVRRREEEGERTTEPALKFSQRDTTALSRRDKRRLKKLAKATGAGVAAQAEEIGKSEGQGKRDGARAETEAAAESQANVDVSGQLSQSKGSGSADPSGAVAVGKQGENDNPVVDGKEEEEEKKQQQRQEGKRKKRMRKRRKRQKRKQLEREQQQSTQEGVKEAGEKKAAVDNAETRSGGEDGGDGAATKRAKIMTATANVHDAQSGAHSTPMNAGHKQQQKTKKKKKKIRNKTKARRKIPQQQQQS